MDLHNQKAVTRLAKETVDNTIKTPTPKDYLYAEQLILMGMKLGIEECLARLREGRAVVTN